MKGAATAIAAIFLCVLACASASAQSVVVNKYFNSGSTADIVELLVIQDALDMRGMYLKDFSSNMVNDGGGKYQFSNDALWSAVPAGTLIVLRNNNSAADVVAGGGDFNLDVGLQNTTYFTNAGGTFDIATTEMVMIKTAASGSAGVTGNIHTLAGGRRVLSSPQRPAPNSAPPVLPGRTSSSTPTAARRRSPTTTAPTPPARPPGSPSAPATTRTTPPTSTRSASSARPPSRPCRR